MTRKRHLSLLELGDGRLVSLTDSFLLLSADQGESWRAFGPKFPFAPLGIAYSRPRKLLYIWHFTCGGGDNPVPDDAIMRVSFDDQAP